jgi:hypothetical protein
MNCARMLWWLKFGLKLIWKGFTNLYCWAWSNNMQICYTSHNIAEMSKKWRGIWKRVAFTHHWWCHTYNVCTFVFGVMESIMHDTCKICHVWSIPCYVCHHWWYVMTISIRCAFKNCVFGRDFLQILLRWSKIYSDQHLRLATTIISQPGNVIIWKHFKIQTQYFFIITQFEI